MRWNKGNGAQLTSQDSDASREQGGVDWQLGQLFTTCYAAYVMSMAMESGGKGDFSQTQKQEAGCTETSGKNKSNAD